MERDHHAFLSKNYLKVISTSLREASSQILLSARLDHLVKSMTSNHRQD